MVKVEYVEEKNVINVQSLLQKLQMKWLTNQP